MESQQERLARLNRDWCERGKMFATPPADDMCKAVARAFYQCAAELRSVLRDSDEIDDFESMNMKEKQ